MIKIASIASTYHKYISNRILKGLILESERESRKRNISIPVSIYKVPGAIELSFVAKQLLKYKSYDAIILLGCVIKGETDHYHYVCSQISKANQKLIMDYDIPIIFSVLTVNSYLQALERSGGKKGNIGCYSMNTAIKMVDLKRTIINNSE